MLVRKTWITEKRGAWNAFVYEGRHYRKREIHWKGIFLFGMLPLWITQERVIFGD